MLLAFARNGSAYTLIEFVNRNGELVNLYWSADSQPVEWFFHNTPPDDFSLDVAIERTHASYDTWVAVETSSITFQFAGRTNAEPFVLFDFINTIGFMTDPSLQGTGILAATDFIVNIFTGEIAESDIFFNADIPWSANANGPPWALRFPSDRHTRDWTLSRPRSLGLGISAGGTSPGRGLRHHVPVCLSARFDRRGRTSGL